MWICHSRGRLDISILLTNNREKERWCKQVWKILQSLTSLFQNDFERISFMHWKLKVVQSYSMEVDFFKGIIIYVPRYVIIVNSLLTHLLIIHRVQLPHLLEFRPTCRTCMNHRIFGSQTWSFQAFSICLALIRNSPNVIAVEELK